MDFESDHVFLSFLKGFGVGGGIERVTAFTYSTQPKG